MKTIIAFLLTVSILCSCSLAEEVELVVPNFKGLNDPDLLQYVEDSVFAEIEGSLQSDNYIVEDVSAIYVSQEYLEEVAFNSQANIFFGYTLAEVENLFQGKKFVFTLGENKETTVIPFEAFEDTSFNQVLKNVAIGTGVILLCATVSVVATTVGAPATISIVFASAAKGASVFAAKGFVFGGISAGIVKAIETGNIEESLKAAVVAGSEGFKWGAISGTVIKGISSAYSVSGEIPTFQEAENAAFEKYGGEQYCNTQVRYYNGQQVFENVEGTSIPDIVRRVGENIEAIEVKRYDLNDQACFNTLKTILRDQIANRIKNLSVGSTQRIVLNVKGRGYSLKLIQNKIMELQNSLSDIYPNIPIDFML